MPINPRNRCVPRLAARAVAWLLIVTGSATAATKAQLRGRSRQAVAPGIQVLSNSFLELQVFGDVTTALNANEGRFLLRTTGGDPDITSDDNLDLTFPTGTTSYSTLRVLTDEAGAQRATPGDFRFNARPVKSATGVITATMPVDVAAATGLGGGPGQTTELQVTQTTALVRHSLEIRYEITNLATVTHQVGLRVMIDTQLGPNDGAPFLLPVIGRITNEQEYFTPDIPSEWIATDDFNSPTVVSQGVMQGSEAVTPDRFVFADWRSINGQVYDYVIDPTRDIITDSAVALYWNPRSVAPGQTLTYVTYYGLGYASADFSNPFVLAATSPFSLRYVKRDDPNTPQTEAELQPNPFVIGAYLFNRGLRQISGASVSLQLPDGLELDTGEWETKQIGNVDALTEGSAQWRVRATGATSGQVGFTVTGGGTLAPAKNVSRTLNVPQLPSGISLEATTQMVSFPFEFADADPLAALGLSASEFRLARYNARTQQYDYYPTTLTGTQLRPGFGYWIQSATTRPLNLRGADILTVDNHVIDLEPGWNQIGNPFPISVYLGSLQVLAGTQLLDWETAISNGYLRGTLFKWDTAQRDYVFSYDPEYTLQPLDGFWLKALKQCSLVVPTAQIIGAIRSRQSGESGSGWRLQLVAAADGLRDANNFLGTSGSASDGYRSREDVEQPPGFGPSVDLHFVHDDWTGVGRSFAQDLRAPLSGAKSWDLEVTTSRSNTDVQLSWPTLAEVPAGVRLTLTDLSTGRATYLRTAGGYTFASGPAGAVHRFRITATNDAGAGLRIVGLREAPSKAVGGKSYTYSLTRPAEVRLAIRTASGRVVFEEPVARGRAAGLNVATWDGRSRSGKVVPRGVYQVELLAFTPEGQSTRALAPTVVR